MNVIEFRTDIQKVQTLRNGGTRLTLDLHDVPPKVIMDLFEVKQAGGVLEVAAVPVFDNELAKNDRKIHF